jgi:hypothetical protein
VRTAQSGVPIRQLRRAERQQPATNGPACLVNASALPDARSR